MAKNKNDQVTSTGIAIHPALVGGSDAKGFLAFLKERRSQGNKCYVMAPMTQGSADKAMAELEKKGAFKNTEDGGYGFTKRETFFPRSQAVLAHHLRSAAINYYVGYNDSFVGYDRFPKGTLGVVVGSASGAAPAFGSWSLLSSFMNAPVIANTNMQSLEALRTGSDANVYRLHTSDKTYLLNTRTVTGESAERFAEEKVNLDGMRKAGIDSALNQVWTSGNAGLFEGESGDRLEESNDDDLNRIINLLINLDNKGDALRGLPKAPDARLHLDSYLKAVNNMWKEVFSAAQASNKDIMFFMMTDLEQLRQDNINHFFLWCKRAKWDKEQMLSDKECIFSPGQIGMHNCLRKGDGVIVLDAAGSGWDDPARLMADFFHNTEQQLTTRRKLLVLDAFVKHREWDTGFLKRFWAVSDLVAVEWILKHLSVILPSERDRLKASLSDEEYDALVSQHHMQAQVMRDSYQPMEHVCKHAQLLEEGEEIR